MNYPHTCDEKHADNPSIGSIIAAGPIINPIQFIRSTANRTAPQQAVILVHIAANIG